MVCTSSSSADTESAARVARNSCELLCAKVPYCWGCSIACSVNSGKACVWNAIPECGRLEARWEGKIEGDVTAKRELAEQLTGVDAIVGCVRLQTDESIFRDGFTRFSDDPHMRLTATRLWRLAQLAEVVQVYLDYTAAFKFADGEEMDLPLELIGAQESCEEMAPAPAATANTDPLYWLVNAAFVDTSCLEDEEGGDLLALMYPQHGDFYTEDQVSIDVRVRFPVCVCGRWATPVRIVRRDDGEKVLVPSDEANLVKQTYSLDYAITYEGKPNKLYSFDEKISAFRVVPSCTKSHASRVEALLQHCSTLHNSTILLGHEHDDIDLTPDDSLANDIMFKVAGLKPGAFRLSVDVTSMGQKLTSVSSQFFVASAASQDQLHYRKHREEVLPNGIVINETWPPSILPGNSTTIDTSVTCKRTHAHTPARSPTCLPAHVHICRVHAHTHACTERRTYRCACALTNSQTHAQTHAGGLHKHSSAIPSTAASSYSSRSQS